MCLGHKSNKLMSTNKGILNIFQGNRTRFVFFPYNDLCVKQSLLLYYWKTKAIKPQESVKSDIYGFL